MLFFNRHLRLVEEQSPFDRFPRARPCGSKEAIELCSTLDVTTFLVTGAPTVGSLAHRAALGCNRAAPSPPRARCSAAHALAFFVATGALPCLGETGLTWLGFWSCRLLCKRHILVYTHVSHNDSPPTMLAYNKTSRCNS